MPKIGDNWCGVGGGWPPSGRVAGERLFEKMVFKLKPEGLGMPFMRVGGRGESIAGRDKSTFKGPGVGKTLVCWRKQQNAD